MFWSHNSIGVKIRRFSITNWIYKSVTCSPLSCFQYTYPDETFRNTEAYARVSTNAQLFARHGTCSYPRNNHCGNQETRWKPVDASAVFFFRGNFTRRWLPSEISVISVRRFIHVKRKRKNWGKNGNDVARSSQKDFIDHRCDATERCIYTEPKKHPRL